ncbi:MAG: ABC transporter ATP-binding protein [Bdellovibrionaceae bacterium]|jgi:ABC-2 type transport system ATP-binding protein|nr:ABC transporter ATP-binding protein [Pseudobdellovibrionaceae bacterium]
MIPLKVSNLVKKYGDLEAVKNVSFEIQSGEIFGLLGPNGAGKTSIISSITTIEKPTSGSIELFGGRVERENKAAKAILGVVPQELVNHGFFSAFEVLEFHSGYYGIRSNKKHIEFLLNKLGLWEHRDKKIKQMSGGMKRRLLIAKALVHQPKLLLLDEPTAGVDIELRASLWDFVRELRDSGTTILLTTHYLEEAEELCDRVGVINHGKLIKIGPTKQLIKELTSRQVAIYLKNKLPPCQHINLIKSNAQEKSMLFEISNQTGIGELLAQLKFPMEDIIDIQIQEGRLEDAFVKLLGDKNELTS